MKMKTAGTIFGTFLLVGASIYFFRATQAEQTAEPVRPGEAQVRGRTTELIIGDYMYGGGYQLVCEYDAWVRIKDGLVLEIADGLWGRALETSPGLPVATGEKVEGDPGISPPDAESKARWGDGVTESSVYRDKDGKLHTGCAPESVITYDP